MGPGKAFVDLLNEFLYVEAGPPILSPGSPVLTQPFIWLEHPRRPTVVAHVPRAAYVPPVTNASPVRPSRHLTRKQQQALDTLVELGAGIDAAFTADELRAAYRRLARHYHPDRHPGAGAQELSRLEVLFSRAHAAYGLLKAVPQVVH